MAEMKGFTVQPRIDTESIDRGMLLTPDRVKYNPNHKSVNEQNRYASGSAHTADDSTHKLPQQNRGGGGSTRGGGAGRVDRDISESVEVSNPFTVDSNGNIRNKSKFVMSREQLAQFINDHTDLDAMSRDMFIDVLMNFAVSLIIAGLNGGLSTATLEQMLSELPQTVIVGDRSRNTLLEWGRNNPDKLKEYYDRMKSTKPKSKINPRR